ncbi:hypothetical protein CAMRE0001_1545 [Campylobacter rectus RM3267]|uniref:Uncharacterized protein n=1 Tax=Campylobacter rectus RM3267 TaxID=553218 RepID=B9CZI7_CAMRE|nr:hypothetical protein CAMRE0001_1545 [Campylobacter rectus RM3267]
MAHKFYLETSFLLFKICRNHSLNFKKCQVILYALWFSKLNLRKISSNLTKGKR